ncbi:MAG TPA: diaminopimelate epimerase [Salinivirgaceae bacterium]|nr:diaminopimelate epimerase [Salinivirgaceae bacterium]HQA76174.1 diaminopimelate epimerase [Salinivirgaceae bacterium]
MTSKQIKFFKYHGAGNDFIMLDNRSQQYSTLTSEDISFLCDRHFAIGADGLIMLENSDNGDFYMRYFNSDGHEGTMCGNGGRCAVLFAHNLKLFDKRTTFFAVDGEHKAELLSNGQIRLKMSDSSLPEAVNDNMYKINTGSPHLVVFVDNVENYDMKEIGRKLRYDTQIYTEGTNVNFCQIVDNKIKIRTYERGVEDETLACGTGSVASSIVSYYLGLIKQSENIVLETKGGELIVSFNMTNRVFDVFLTGPAKNVFEGIIEIV